jgi:gas vesicle protein
MVRFLSGLMLGVVAGLIGGLLFAPWSGQEMRDTIGERAVELKDRAIRRVDAAEDDIVLDI